jgi:hypothetical protein
MRHGFNKDKHTNQNQPEAAAFAEQTWTFCRLKKRANFPLKKFTLCMLPRRQESPQSSNFINKIQYEYKNGNPIIRRLINVGQCKNE